MQRKKGVERKRDSIGSKRDLQKDNRLTVIADR